MNASTQNYRDLRAKARRLAGEIARLAEKVGHPVNFARPGEVPHATHIGWNTNAAWFYTPSAVKEDLLRRQDAASAKLAALVEKRKRALAKASRMFARLPWCDRAALRMVGADPP